MPKAQVVKNGFRCSQCGWIWVPRLPDVPPAVCPQCKRKDWDGK